MSMNKTSDAVFVKNLQASENVTATQAAATAIDLGALEANVQPMCEQDVTAVSGTTPSVTDLIEGSDDNVTFVEAGRFTASAAVARKVIDLLRFRYYRRGASIAYAGSSTPIVTRSLKIIGIASVRPVTQP